VLTAIKWFFIKISFFKVLYQQENWEYLVLAQQYLLLAQEFQITLLATH